MWTLSDVDVDGDVRVGSWGDKVDVVVSCPRSDWAALPGPESSSAGAFEWLMTMMCDPSGKR